jgi:ABC-2 type transport system ATP-binding protein
MAEPLLVAEHLTKVFRRRFYGRVRAPQAASQSTELRAVDDVNLEVRRGDIFGFLGPNGAGKSTTIRMLLGLIHPTSGRAVIGGHDVAEEKTRALRLVGAFVEAPSFYLYLSAMRNLEIFSGLSGGAPPQELARILELTGLRGRERELVKVYSHGMRQRLGLAVCLLPRPEVLILDEPADGLDPHGVREVRELIRRLALEEGMTVFLSSQMLNQLENLCNRVAFLDCGKVILQGELEALEREHRLWRIETDRPESAGEFLRTRFNLAPRAATPGSPAWLVRLGDRRPEELAGALVSAGFALRALAPEVNWLDRLFLELTTNRESAARPGEGGA